MEAVHVLNATGGSNAYPSYTRPSSDLIDAFGRNRVAEPLTLFEIQHQYNTQPLFWDTTLTNSGTVTHLPNESSVELAVTTTSGSKVVRQSKQYLRYQPGKSQEIVLTAMLGAKKTNVVQREGLRTVASNL